MQTGILGVARRLAGDARGRGRRHRPAHARRGDDAPLSGCCGASRSRPRPSPRSHRRGCAARGLLPQPRAYRSAFPARAVPAQVADERADGMDRTPAHHADNARAQALRLIGPPRIAAAVRRQRARCGVVADAQRVADEHRLRGRRGCRAQRVTDESREDDCGRARVAAGAAPPPMSPASKTRRDRRVTTGADRRTEAEAGRTSAVASLLVRA